MADIDKLSGSPYTDVLDWMYEEIQKKKKDPGLPLRPSNTREDKKIHQPVAKLRVVLNDLVGRVNLIIDELTLLREYVDTEVETLKTDVQNQISSHANLMSPSPGGHMQGSSAGTTTTGGRRGGLLQKDGINVSQRRDTTTEANLPKQGSLVSNPRGHKPVPTEPSPQRQKTHIAGRTQTNLITPQPGAVKAGNRSVTVCDNIADFPEIWEASYNYCGGNRMYETFSFKDLYSQPGNGPVLIFDIAASWCSPCYNALLDLDELNATFHNDILIIADLNDPGQPYSCGQWSNATNFGLPVIDKNPGDYLYYNYLNSGGWPSAVIIDNFGYIVEKQAFPTVAEHGDLIQSVLDSPQRSICVPDPKKDLPASMLIK